MAELKLLTVVCGFYQEDITLMHRTLNALVPIADYVRIRIVADFNSKSVFRNSFIAELNNYKCLEIEYIDFDENIGVPFIFNVWLKSLQTKYFTVCGEGDVLNFSKDFLISLNSIGDDFDLILSKSGFKEDLDFDWIHANELLKHKLQNKMLWSQIGAIMKSSHVETSKIVFDSGHYWDETFQLTYLMNSRKVLLDEFVEVQRNADLGFELWTKQNYGLNILQVPLIRFKFVKNNLHILLFKGIGIFVLFRVCLWIAQRMVKLILHAFKMRFTH